MANGGSGVPMVPRLIPDTWDIMNNGVFNDGGWVVNGDTLFLHAVKAGCGEVEWRLYKNSPEGVPKAEMSESSWNKISGGELAEAGCSISKGGNDYHIEYHDGDKAVVP